MTNVRHHRWQVRRPRQYGRRLVARILGHPLGPLPAAPQSSPVTPNGHVKRPVAELAVVVRISCRVRFSQGAHLNELAALLQVHNHLRLSAVCFWRQRDSSSVRQYTVEIPWPTPHADIHTASVPLGKIPPADETPASCKW
jgi:hypothetical protein